MLWTARDITRPARARPQCGGSADPPLLAHLRRVVLRPRAAGDLPRLVRADARRLADDRPARRRRLRRDPPPPRGPGARDPAAGPRPRASPGSSRASRARSRRTQIMDAIVEELGVGTGADHVVIVRRRPDARVLEATLVNARSGGPPSTTLFPITDLEDPPALADAERREPLAVPIEVGPAPSLVAVGAAGAAAAAAVAPGQCRPSRSGPRPDATTRGGAAPRSAGAGQSRADRATLDRRFARPRAADRASAAADRIALRARRVFGLKHTLVAPLTTDAGVIGAIVVSRRTADPWPESAHRILAGAAAEASAALSRAYSHRQAEARASTDALTGLPNRRYFDEFCALLARRRRAEDGVGVLMVDIDKFKVAQRHPRPPGRRRGAAGGRRRRSPARSARTTSRPATAARSSRSCSATRRATWRSRSASASAQAVAAARPVAVRGGVDERVGRRRGRGRCRTSRSRRSSSRPTRRCSRRSGRAATGSSPRNSRPARSDVTSTMSRRPGTGLMVDTR